MNNLGTENFYMIGNSMCINITNNMLIFFKLPGCQGCAAFESVFLNLSNSDKRISYGIVDLGYHKQIIQMSRSSNTVIDKVPYLVLYIQGKPFAKFKGDKNIETLKRFITNALEKVPPPQSNSQQRSFISPNSAGYNTQPQQNLYGGSQPRGGVYMPDVQPSRQAMKVAGNSYGNVGYGSTHPSMQNQCEEGDESCITNPPDVIPYNTPWESDFKKHGV